MAKKSAINKNLRRIEMSKKQGPARAALRKAAINMNLSEEERWDARVKLQKMKRDGSPSRVVDRCRVTGRPRGTFRRFGLSRIAFRELALAGQLPGVTKASW